MAFWANGQNFGQFTACGKYLSIVFTRNFFYSELFSRLTVKICQFLRLMAKFFGRFTANS